MINIARIKEDEQKTTVHVQMPKWLRNRAKKMANEQSNDRITVTESDVYRTAILLFFDEIDTKCIDRKEEYVSDEGGDADSESA